MEVPGIELKQPDSSACPLSHVADSSISALEFSWGIFWGRKDWVQVLEASLSKELNH